MATIAFLINPIAGMGGTVGLKGTDRLVDEARRRGAVPRAEERAVAALSTVDAKCLTFLTCGGSMGENALTRAGIASYRVVYMPGAETSAADTSAAARAFLAEGADLLLFCGGDGTARDLFDAVDATIPILGIPAGVKMYSGVFATSPSRVGEILARTSDLAFRDGEVMDVDEEAYRGGTLATRLYGYAKVPHLPSGVQGCKTVGEAADEERAKEEIARFIADVMADDILYIIGAGTTTAAITRALGIEGTLLGVDVIKNRNLVARDACERDLLRLVEAGERCRIIVSPIGAQGFVLGRGTQQISPAVVRKAGAGRVTVVATPQKLAATPALYIDLGDPELEAQFGDVVEVVSGYCIAQRKPLIHS
ncbi:MAG: ATP-NAD kinase family protein [Methanomicrobiaceae archaeon]|nr:ATP-NAD kinase family protein [Methanomicrobiaceae archaeon]